MADAACAVCAFELTDGFFCPACDAAEAVVHAGGCHPNYQEQLAEKIGDLLQSRDWHSVIDLSKRFPGF